MMLWLEVSRLLGSALEESNLLVGLGTSLLVHNVGQAEVVVVVEQVVGFMVACTDQGEGQLDRMDMEVVGKLE